MRHWLKRNYLPITVFVTGAGVLVIEVVATRILSPYFGNTIFTVSSVLTVVLAALSLGYYVGGRISDKQPNNKTFFGIILVGGLSVLALHWAQVLILPTLGVLLPLTYGPLVTSVVLFFVPSLLLGMLSPFAIKLAQVKAVKDQGLGSIVGSIFFFSTMGSIAGSLAAGYLLVPNFGVGSIILGVGLGLVGLGIVPLLLLGMDKRTALKIGVVVLLFVLSHALVSPTTNALYDKNGVYEKITITEGTYQDRPARFLYSDRSASGAMFLDGDDLAYDYTKYYALHEVFTPDVNRALFIGGGAYSMPKALLKDLPEVQIDALEIEPELVDLSKKYFDLPNDPRLNTPIADGRRFLHDAPTNYDYIFSDVYDSYYSIPMHFTTQDFFQLAYDKLNDDGVFMANIIGNLGEEKPSFLWSEVRTLQTIFPYVYVFAVGSPDDDSAVQNLILVGHKSSSPTAFGQNENSHHQAIRELAGHQVDIHKYDLSDYQVLTDDYAPVESWTGGLLRSKE